MASSASVLAAMLVAVGCAAAASATEMDFYVGDAQGWTTGVDYTAWAKGKPFEANDRLVFRYSGEQHTVTEVTKSDYDACAVSGTPIITAEWRQTAVTFITLRPGTHYYFCKVGNHCVSGMKLAVTVSNSSDTPRAQPWSPPRAAPTGASTRLHAGSGAVVAAAAVGVLVKLALW
ncbi:blue copper protein-like [Oryza brachyantha]|uniref:blue copper protein-like n=1 Tax=Oryza brachyantha TaxID=4533 RepID=UPI001ADCC230|nr:blue copper protein-like [Oryza brachyantha]